MASRSAEIPAGATPRRRRRLVQSRDRLIYICTCARVRMRMLYEPVVARAPALPLQPRVRLLAPKTPNARTCVLWNHHHTCHMPDPGSGGPAPTAAHDNHHGNHRGVCPAIGCGVPAASLRGWSFCVLYLPGLSVRALLSGLAVWALSVRPS